MPASLTRPPIIFRRVCWIGVGLWAATVFTLSSLSGPEVEELNIFNAWDKLLHFTAFFCGALPFIPALRLTRDWRWSRIVWVATLLMSAYGALDEVHQMFSPSRSALDPGDWIADTLGAAVGSIVTAFFHARFTRTTRPAEARD